MKKISKAVGTLGLVGCAVLNSPLAMAADSGWLGGLSIGQSRATIDDARIKAQLLDTGLTTTSMKEDERDTAYKIFAGYKFSPYFALEGGYFNLGQFDFRATTVPAGTLNGNIKLQGLNFDAVGILPITKRFSALGRVGFNFVEAKDKFSNTGAVAIPTDASPSQTDLNYKIGFGAQYDVTESIGVRAEWERHRIDDAVGNLADIDMVSLGLVVKFGGNKPAPAPTPAPVSKVVTPPAPAPVVAAAPVPARVIVPVPVQTAQYCSILDIQFEINQDAIQRQDKEKLAVLGTFLKKYPDTTAVIEGHADDVGTSADNMKLSQVRAESVVSYLVAEHNIASSRLTAVGYGETRPLADNSTGQGKQMNRRIGAVIACATDIEGLKVLPARITMALEMEFDPYKNDIKPEYRAELQKVADFLKANPAVTATMEGHADKVAGNVPVTPKVSMDVSQRRAQAVVNYLADELGVSRSRLSTAAFGQTRLVDYGTTLEGQQENRRVNIVFNYE